MKKQKITFAHDIILLGLTARTNNKKEMNPQASKIGTLAGKYWGEQIANQFKNRVQSGVTYSVYTEFESDEHGEYTYFIGEAVSSLEGQDLSKFKSIVIPAGTYQKFTTDSGKMPDVVIHAWQAIWKMTPADFGGKRQYRADFEVYDHRAQDPNNTVVDVYVGVDG